jgi:hypothetical protein
MLNYLKSSHLKEIFKLFNILNINNKGILRAYIKSARDTRNM